eukprot:TRINITY_DN27063_c0_g1_i1.p1 TRINITY_DN27063_c0_g1~~TRINITY_DN27063_c0_g1_i1.p1  ORF type:complete len:401 (-),score=95.81 TRINITY_DN27063_c0_g1_i1:165-1367(-)
MSKSSKKARESKVKKNDRQAGDGEGEDDAKQDAETGENIAASGSAALTKSAKRRAQKKRAEERLRESSGKGGNTAKKSRTESSGGNPDVSGKGGNTAKKSRTESSGGKGKSSKPTKEPLPVVYEDRHVLAINKPAGLLCHPSPGFWDKGTVYHELEGREQIDGFSEIPAEMLEARQSYTGEHDSFIPRAIVHRLDRGTTGLMILAKTPGAEEALTEQFKQRTLNKRYVALLAGLLDIDSANAQGVGEVKVEGKKVHIDAPIDRDDSRPGKMKVGWYGKPAQSILRIHARSEAAKATLVSVKLLSGRTHQIRVHCSFLGASLVNDDMYCDFNAVREWRSWSKALLRGRPLLHAWSLEVPHPKASRGDLAVQAPLPPDMASCIKELWPELGEDPAEWPKLKP